jgi:nicotinamidase-related amidase
LPITVIDSTSALVVIDLQKGIAKMPVVHPAADVIANAVRLVEAFRERERPVVLVRVGWRLDGTDAIKTRAQVPRPAGGVPPEFMEFVDELEVDTARDIVIQKRQWGAFYGTDLDLQLRRRGVTNIVLCGIATSIGVESTARDAWERSYNLTFAMDSMTDRDEGAHTRSLEVIFPRIGELGTTSEIIAKL